MDCQKFTSHVSFVGHPQYPPDYSILSHAFLTCKYQLIPYSTMHNCNDNLCILHWFMHDYWMILPNICTLVHFSFSNSILKHCKVHDITALPPPGRLQSTLTYILRLSELRPCEVLSLWFVTSVSVWLPQEAKRLYYHIADSVSLFLHCMSVQMEVDLS